MIQGKSLHNRERVHNECYVIGKESTFIIWLDFSYLWDFRGVDYISNDAKIMLKLKSFRGEDL